MPSNLNQETLAGFSRETLCEIHNHCIDTIKENGLYTKKTGDRWLQKDLATHLEIKPRAFSTARNAVDKTTKEQYIAFITAMANAFDLVLADDKKTVLPRRPLTESPLDQLAAKLALNLLDVSTSFAEPRLGYQHVFSDEHIWEVRKSQAKPLRERFIAIVGAGASNAATPASLPIPTSVEAMVALRKAYLDKIDETWLEEEITRLRNQLRSEADDFEVTLLALTRFNAQHAIKHLDELCGHRHTPSLAYEVLAHLFKHRFLDIIVNFNYDELLDNAIVEEMPNSRDYKFIYTAGHCPASIDEFRIDNRLKYPIYIKCHGTISQPNSLRFTEDKSFVIEKAIQEHLTELLIGKYHHGQLPVNLLVFGFGMKNRVFNELIERAVQQTSEKMTIWLFDTNPKLADEVRNRFASYLRDGRQRIEVKEIPLQGPYAMTTTIVELWEKVSNSFTSPYQPKGIARHQMVNHFFGKVSPRELISEQKRRTYYEDRLLVELCMLVLQSNGIVHISQLPNSRAGKYLELLKDLSGNDDKTVYDYFKKIGLRPYEGFMYDTFILNDHTLLRDTEKLIDFLCGKLHDLLDSQRKQFLASDGDIQTFKRLALSVRQRQLLMVNPQYQHIHDNLFGYVRKEHVMNTSLAWIYNYRKHIEQNLDQWDLMLAVTEEGRFLRKDAMEGRFKDKYFEVILASNAFQSNDEAEVASSLSNLNLLSGNLKYRPWWMHNKHLVLLLKRNPAEATGNWKRDWTLVEGFFYRQTMLSRRVNPVKVTDKRDLEKLLIMFAIYWYGANNTPVLSPGVEQQIGLVTQGAQKDEIIKDLLGRYSG